MSHKTAKLARKASGIDKNKLYRMRQDVKTTKRLAAEQQFEDQIRKDALAQGIDMSADQMSALMKTLKSRRM